MSLAMFAAAKGYGYPIVGYYHPLRSSARQTRIRGIHRESAATLNPRRSRRSIDPSALGSADHCNIGPDRRILSRRKGTDNREERGGLPLGRSGLYLVDRSISCLGLSADTWRIKYSDRGSRERERPRVPLA